MPIENNIKTPETQNQIFGKDPIRSQQEKTVMFRIKQWVVSHRLNSRQKLLVNPINLAMVGAFLPLALGFSQFLINSSRSSHNFGKSNDFFEKNLPVFTQFKPKLNFETFEYISKSNSKIPLKPIDHNLKFGQSKFQVTLKQPSLIRTNKFNGLSCNFYLLTSGNFISKTSSNRALNRNLDELPAYFEGLKSSKEYTIRQDSIFDKVKPEMSKISELQNKKTLKKNQRKKTSFDSISNLRTRVYLVSSFQPLLDKNFSSELVLNSNQLYKDRLDFYTDVNKFNAELENLFTKKTVSCFSGDLIKNVSEQNLIKDDISLLNLFLNQKSEVSDEFLIEIILQELEKTTISEDSKNLRFMSGYMYPDMTSQELKWFYLGTPWKSKTGENSILQNRTLPSTSKNYKFNVKNFPKISIETNQVSLRKSTTNLISGSEYTNSFYTGPALILDSKRALDWKTTGKQNLRSWFHTYISPLNPLRQPVENFFGVYDSPKFVKDNKTTFFETEFEDLAKTSLFSGKFTSGPGPFVGFFDALEESGIRFSPSNFSFQFPSDKEQLKTSLMRTLEVNLSKNTDTEDFITLPLLQLQHPSSLSVNSENPQLQNYSSDFSFISKGNPDYSFSTDPFTTKNFVTKYTSGSYTKTESIYSKTRQSTHINVDNWEPLTSTWWLVITQFSFAFFSFQVLKSLADNYGRELLGYLLDLVAFLGFLDDSLKQQIEILLGQRDKGFKVVLESRRTFTDIVGIKKLLPEIYEVIWFLRNSAREFSLSKTLPRGFLLTGPPGTGKTLLVQALAGEAQVPAVVLSGSSLIGPGESGASKLENAFQEARSLAPCIIFIDEIDTLAQKRVGVVQNPMGSDELVESLTSFEKPRVGSLFEQMDVKREEQENETLGDRNIQNSSHQEELSLLTQFLIELDGIQGRDGVIVIGATNRPDVLDPALLRPGRLEKIIQVGLPGHKKRVEILQFYGQGLGYQSTIPWNYLGDRTDGFSAADLATLMNESTIKAILMETKHTMETIEHGIDRLTTSENEKYTVFKTHSCQNDKLSLNSVNLDIDSHSATKLSCLTVASKMTILRLAYYQAGKIVLSYVLENHPKSVVASLWPRRPTIRSAQIATNLQNSLFEFARLCEITDRLIGCYAGKAAEVLFIQQFSSSKAHLSTLGIEDLLFAQKLVYSILEWSFFSKKNQIQRKVYLDSNINTREFREIPEKLDLYTGVVKTIEIPERLMKKAIEENTSSLAKNKKTGLNTWSEQIYYSIPWWQQQISDELEFVEKNFTNWSRLYISNPEQNERNPEWFPPDEWYHSSSGLKNVKKAFTNLQIEKTKNLKNTEKNNASIKEQVDATKNISKNQNVKERFLPQKADFSWNEVALLTRDYPGHSLILESFNKALVILNKNRELLDRLVVELLYKEILHQPDIEKLVGEFISTSITSEEKLKLDADSSVAFKISDFEPDGSKDNKPKLKILESSWGLQSRKPMPRWIDFAEF